MPPFTPIPLRLETKRLVLTPQEVSDAGWLAQLFTARGRGPVTPAQASERIAAMRTTVAQHGIGARVLRAHGSDEALGYVAVVVGRGTLAEPELAYELLPSAHGHGYATEASRALLAAAFATGRDVVQATIRPWNHASLRVAQKLGLQLERTTVDDDGEIQWWRAESRTWSV